MPSSDKVVVQNAETLVKVSSKTPMSAMQALQKLPPVSNAVFPGKSQKLSIISNVFNISELIVLYFCLSLD